MLEGLLVDLVPYGTKYLELDHKWRNGPAWFWAGVGDRPILSEAQIKRMHQERAEARAERRSDSVYFGVQAKDGVRLGDIGLNWVLPHHRLGMLGAMIGEPEYWGGGYGTDALLLMVDYAFDWLDFHKLWLGTMGLNVRVMRQMEKVGFRLEARQRSANLADGQRTDNLLYGLLRDEWPGRAAVIERIGLRAKAENPAAGAE